MGRLAGLVGLSAIWGTQFLIIKIGQETVPPLLTVALRYAVLLVVAQAAVMVCRSVAPVGLWRGRVAFGLAQALSMGLLYWAQARIPSALAAILLGTTPFLVAVLAHFFVAGERLAGRTAVSTFVGFCGVTMITLGSISSDGRFELQAAGVVAVLLAALTDAVTKVLAKKLTSVMPVPVMLRDMALVVAITAGLASLALESSAPADVTARTVVAFIYLGVVGSAAASALYLVLLRRYTVSGLAYLQFTTALVAVLTGLLVGRERLDATTIAGAVAILAGLAVRSSWIRKVS